MERTTGSATNGSSEEAKKTKKTKRESLETAFADNAIAQGNRAMGATAVEMQCRRQW
jgi:hypothetical protein